MLEYIALWDMPELKDAAADWLHGRWGVPKEAYLECMDAYLSGKTEYGWYFCLDDGLIVGGVGGRVDHTLANFQALRYAVRRGAHAEMNDGDSWAAVIEDGAIAVPRDVAGMKGRRQKLSVFALSDACRGVCIRGAKWELSDATLTSAFPLGLSNEFATDEARIAVRSGALLVTVCGE